MRFQAPVSALLALLLGFSCYPFNTSFNGFYGEEMGGSPAESANFWLADFYLDRAYADQLDSSTLEVLNEVQSNQDYLYGDGDSSSVELPSSDYLTGDEPTFSPDSDYGYDGGSASSDDLISPRVAPAVLLGWAATALGAGASVTSILSSLNSLFGSPSGSSMSRTEALLSSILGWQYNLSNDLGSLGTRLSNLYTLLNQMYTNDIKGIYSLISTIGVNTELFKLPLNNISARLFYSGGLAGDISGDFSAANLLARIYGQTYLTSNRVLSLNSSVSSLLLYSGGLAGDISGDFSAANLLARIYGQTYLTSNHLNSISSFMSYDGRLAGYPNDLPSKTYRVIDLLIYIYNNGILTVRRLDSILSKLDNLNFSFDDSRLLSSLSDILTALSENGAIAIAVDVDTRELSNLRAVELKAIYEAIKEIPGGGGGDLLDKVLSGVDAIGSVLGGISGFLNPGEVVSGVSDVLGNLSEIPEVAESLIGDLQFDSLDALASNIGSVVQNKFPFSIPFVFSGFLLMFKVPASPPFFEFDFWGAPLVLDFSEYGAFADFTRFFSVAFFFVGLLSVTRRFIFFGGGSGAD